MIFTSEELTRLNNPYQDLGNGDSLAEHQEELDKLSLDEMRDLATRMLSQCPDAELNQLAHAIEAIRPYTPSAEKPSFHAVMQEALGVKKRILSLTDKRNHNPQNMILDDELSVEHFHTFRTLAQNVLNDREVTIATRLVLNTEAKALSQLAFKIQTLFPNSVLATKVQSACGLSREINRFLLGDNPLKFFTSEEFNMQRCFEFSKLFKLVDGKETTIAEQCVMSLPEGQQQITAQVNELFAGSLLAEEIEQAYTVRDKICSMLLSAAPATFFLDPDFDADQCNKFARLFQHQIQGQEQHIGKQLASLNAETRSIISRKLETLNNAAHAQEHCVRQIAKAMNQQEPLSIVASGNSLFSTGTKDNSDRAHASECYQSEENSM